MQCISIGEERKKYESGDKASVIRPAAGVILEAMPFRNDYDDHAIELSSEQAGQLTGRKIEILAGDRGYRGREEISGTKIVIPNASETEETRTVPQTCRRRTVNRPFEVRLPPGPRLS